MKEARLLGAVIAGGPSTRFGSDKALAQLDGKAMIDHVLDSLRPQVQAIVVCGRNWPGERSLEDRFGDRIGPLAGLEAALRYACSQRFDGVMTVPVDTLPIPRNLRETFAGQRPSVFRQQHLIGYWPVSFAAHLKGFLDDGGRAARDFIVQSGARLVEEPIEIANFNFSEDLRSGAWRRQA